MLPITDIVELEGTSGDSALSNQNSMISVLILVKLQKHKMEIAKIIVSFTLNNANNFSSAINCFVCETYFGTDVFILEIPRQESTTVFQISQGEFGTVNLRWMSTVSMMKDLKHPNVVQFYGVMLSPDDLCFVTEFLPRSLFRLLHKGKAILDWRRRIQIALDIARGMNYLHCGHIHRGLKSSNLLVKKNWTVKVADFGLTRAVMYRLKVDVDRSRFHSKAGETQPCLPREKRGVHHGQVQGKISALEVMPWDKNDVEGNVNATLEPCNSKRSKVGEEAINTRTD